MFKHNRFAGHAIRFGALLAVMAALVILPLGAAAKGNGSGVDGTLVVKVVDTATGLALTGASVQVWDANGAVVASGVTSNAGYYQVDLAPGYYKPMGEAKGYNVATVAVLITSGQVSEASIPLNPNPPVPGCCSGAPTGSAGIRH